MMALGYSGPESVVSGLWQGLDWLGLGVSQNTSSVI